jgi:hypothetical protein
MMYTRPSFKTKSALKQAVKDGAYPTIYQPNAIPGVSDGPIPDGRHVVEGPSFEMHRWYANVRVEGGRVVKVIG